MKSIERPRDPGEAGIMMHLAQFLLVQICDILAHIMLAPEEATPAPIYDKVHTAHRHVTRALQAFEEHKKTPPAPIAPDFPTMPTP